MSHVTGRLAELIGGDILKIVAQLANDAGDSYVYGIRTLGEMYSPTGFVAEIDGREVTYNVKCDRWQVSLGTDGELAKFDQTPVTFRLRNKNNPGRYAQGQYEVSIDCWVFYIRRTFDLTREEHEALSNYLHGLRDTVAVTV